MFEAMAGLPVTIRLLDPPLHEFLPGVAEVPRRSSARGSSRPTTSTSWSTRSSRSARLEETNPMIGTRGVRLGVLEPEIYRAQAVAIMRAATAVREQSGAGARCWRSWSRWWTTSASWSWSGDLIVETGEQEGLELGSDYTVGSMLELPRACFVGDRIAEHADFFSFGTNDLTQTGLGFSRDDIEQRHPGPLPRPRHRGPEPVRDHRRPRASASWCGWARGWDARPSPS